MATNTTALASRFRVDLTVDLTLAGGWTQLVGLSDFKPDVNQNIVETSSYDNNGWESYEKTFQGWSAAATCWMRTTSGLIHPSIQLLLDRELAFGDACRIGLRYYDKNGGAEARQGVGVVSTKRGNTGVKDPETRDFMLQGDGALVVITNPGVAAAVPTLLSALPSGAAAAAQVQINGSGFTGTTLVKFAAVTATTFTVVSDSVIVVTVPAGTAGSAPVTVTNAVGISTALPYTRA